jgi:ubiquinone/menaquinone biosynthesis C-methylase UbiE
MSNDDYVLGTDSAELQRLSFQHEAWVAQAFALWQRAGLRTGMTVLDLGSGPGFTSFDLAQLVGPTGRVIARDRSARFLEYVAAESKRRGLGWIEPSLGDVETLELAPASVDAIYARWLFCWLPDAALGLERAARALRPGGPLVLQEYLDWAAMKLLPREPAFDRAVAACMQSWKRAEATIDIAEHVPALAAHAGLVVEHFSPIARAGRVGSLEWRWMSEFFHAYLPKVVEAGLLTSAEAAAALRPFDEARPGDARYCVTPTMTDVILRKA